MVTRVASLLRSSLRSRVVRTAVVAIVVACGWGLSLSAQQAPLRKIGELELAIRGLTATTETRLTVPKNVPSGIRVTVNAGAAAVDAADAFRLLGGPFRIAGELAGPGLPQTLSLPEGTPDSDPFLLRLPGLTRAGLYTLANLRLVRDEIVNGAPVERTVLDVSPSRVDIEVIDEVLITSVTTRPLTLDEIKQKGIVLDGDDYLGFEFTMAMKLESTPVNVSFPVVFDRQGVALPSLLTPPGVSRAAVPLPTIVPMLLEARTTGEAGGGARIPLTLDGGQEIRIPSLIVIPGNVGYLKQFFSAQLFVANGAPAGARLTVRDITGTIALPAGADAQSGTDDDPLSLAQTAGGQTSVLPIRGLGLDGLAGTADDRSDLGPGEQGQAEFLIRGEKEGFHAVSFDIEAALDGLPIGPVTVTGKASGGVLVRNPYYDITFTAPAVVRDGEDFELYATVTNIGQGIANDLSLALDASRMSGLHLNDSEGGVKHIQTLRAGDAATLKFRFTSERTGKVVASYLRFDTTNGTTGGLNFTVGVGERGVPLSPDTLVLPAVVDDLPDTVVAAAMRVLGQAWSAANAPAGTLRPGVTRPSKDAVIGKALALAEAGLRRTLGQSENDALSDLALDWYVGAPPTQPTAAIDPGLDQIHRDTDAGHALARAFGQALAPAVQAAGGPLAFEAGRAAVAASGPDFASFVVTGATGAITLEDAAGRRSLVSRTAARGVLEVPGAAFLPLGSQPDAPVLGLITRPLSGVYTIGVENSSTVAVGTTSPRFGGGMAHASSTFAPEDGAVEATVQVDLARPDRVLTSQAHASGDDVQPVGTTPIVSQGPRLVSATVIGPETLDSAGPFGLNALLLFDRVVDPTRAAQPSTYRITRDSDLAVANSVVGAEAVLSGRFVAVSLAQPEGPNVPMHLAVMGLPDARGAAGSDANLPLASRLQDPGAVVTGRVQQADGTPVAGDVVYANNTDLVTCYPIQGNTGLSRTTLDASGHYEFRYVRQDNCGFPFTIASTDPQTGGRTEQSRHVRTPGERIVVDFTLFARGSITGVVRDLQTGRPVPGARVVAVSVTDPQVGAVATTDGDGRYFVTGITVGAVTVRAVSGTSAGSNTGRIHEGGTTASVDVTLDGGTVSVVGRVRSRAGEPLRGAVVSYTLLPLGGQPSLVGAVATNELGDYRLEGLPVGAYSLVATYDIRSAAKSGTAAANDVIDGNFDLDLPAFGTVVGQVLLPGDVAAVNAIVSVGGRGTLSDATGHFRIPNVPVGPQVVLAATDNELQQGTQPVTVVRDVDSAPVTVRLSGLANAEFIVLGPNGEVLTDATVVIGGTCHDPCGCASATTATGRARFTGLRLGRVDAKAIRPVGAYDSASTSITLTTHGETVVGTIQLRGFGTVRGVVRLANNQLAMGADVLVQGRRFVNDGIFQCGMTRSEFRIRTDNQGVYQVSNVGIGPVTVTATHEFAPTPASAVTELTLAGQARTVDLQLTDTTAGELSGTVLLPNGTTPASAGVEVTVSGQLPDVTVRTGADGRFRFARIFPEGRYSLTARDPFTGGQAQEQIYLRTALNLDQPIRLRGRGRVIVDVVDAAGIPVRPATVVMTGAQFPSQRFEHSLVGEADARATFESVFEGPLSISATDLQGRGARLSSEMPRDGAEVRVTVQLNPVGTVTGLFLMPDQSPIPFGTVSLYVNNRVIGQATTGEFGTERGRFRFDYVPTGAFRVEATDPATARSGSTTGTLASQGETATVNVVIKRLGTVQGLVTANGNAQPGAVVEVVVGQAQPIRTTADSNAQYHVEGVPVGDVTVNASLDGSFLKGTATGVLADVDGSVATIDVALRTSRVVRGRVTTFDNDSAPFATVTVQVDGGSTQTTSTDPDGNYRFERVPSGLADFTVRAADGLDQNALDDQTIAAGAGDVVVNLPLTGLGSIEGRILDASGNPIAGQLRVDGKGRFFYRNNLNIDGTGQFAWPALLAGPVEFRVDSAAGAFAFALSNTVPGAVAPQRPGTPPAHQDVSLEPAGTVSVRVLRASGVGAAGASVQLRMNSTGRIGNATADVDGRVVLRGVPLGSFTGSVGHVASGGVALVPPVTVSTNAQVIDLGTITLEETPFSVLSVFPAAGATEVSPFEQVRVVFSVPIQNAIHVDLRTAAGSVTGLTKTLSADGRTVTFSGILPVSTDLTVSVSSQVLDIYGRPVPAVTSGFRTSAVPALRVESISIPDGAINVAPFTPIEVRFSVPLKPTSASSVRTHVNVFSAGHTLGTLSPDGRTVTIVGNYQTDSQYELEILSFVTDIYNQTLPQTIKTYFSTTSLQPPRVLNASFVERSNFQTTPGLSFSFNEPVQPVADVVRITGPDGTRYTGVAQFNYGSVLYNFPTALPGNTRYTVTIDGLRDLSGNVQATPYTTWFSVGDNVAPAVTFLEPAGKITGARRPLIRLGLFDAVSIRSVSFVLDGIGRSVVLTDTSVSFTPTSDLSFGPHTVSATVQDWAGNTTTFNDTFTVTANPTTTLRVTYLRQDGNPGINARVDLTVNGTPLSPVFTNNAGVATLSNLAIGPWSVRVTDGSGTRPGATATGTFVNANIGQTVDVLVRQTPAGTVTISTFAAGRTPLAFAEVHAAFPHDTCVADCPLFTDAAGRLVLSHAAPANGVATVTASWDGAPGVTASGSGTIVHEGDSVAIDVDLPLSVVRATVRHADGTLVADPSVFASYVDAGGVTQVVGGMSVPDGSGGYVPGQVMFVGLPLGPVTLFAQDWVSGLAGTTSTAVTGTAVADALVTLEAGGTVTGIVRDSQNAPVAGASVEVTGVVGVMRPTIADASGAYSMARVPLGVVTVRAEASTHLAAAVTGTLVASGDTLVLDVPLPPSGSVAGVVRDGQGTPIPNAVVSVSSADNSVTASRSADGNGAYRADYIAVGAVQVSASHRVTGLSGLATGEILAAGDVAPVDVTTDPSGTVTGIVRSATGTPVAGASITLYLNFAVFAVTDGNGTFTIPFVPLGEYSVDAVSPGGIRTSGTVVIDTAGGQGNVELTLPVSTTLSGRLLNATTGLSLPAGTVVDFRIDGHSVSISLDGEGRFFLPAVPVGTVWIFARYSCVGVGCSRSPTGDTTILLEEGVPGELVLYLSENFS